jgi:hypothetical protein
MIVTQARPRFRFEAISAAQRLHKPHPFLRAKIRGKDKLTAEVNLGAFPDHGKGGKAEHGA